MGTLGGHLLPGSFFAMFAIWWGFITSLRYVQHRHYAKVGRKATANGGGGGGTKQNRATETSGGYQSTVWMPCICLPCGPRARRAPIECWMKAILAFIALVIEAYTAVSFHTIEVKQGGTGAETAGHDEHGGHGADMSDGHSSHVHERSAAAVADTILLHTWRFEKGNAQHITMYSSFVLGSIVEIMIYHGVDLPNKLDYGLGILSFTIEAFLFAFHLHAKAPVEVYLHVLLVYAIVGCVLFCALESYDDTQILFTYGRILFTLLQGTWFYQAGFMLYPPTDDPAWHYDLNDHGLIMVITVCFCWHVLLIVIGLLLQFWLVKRIYNGASDCLRSRLDELIYIDRVNHQVRERTQMRPAKPPNGNAMSMFALNSDDEDVHLVVGNQQNDE